MFHSDAIATTTFPVWVVETPGQPEAIIGIIVGCYYSGKSEDRGLANVDWGIFKIKFVAESLGNLHKPELRRSIITGELLYSRNIRIAKRRQLQLHIANKLCPRPFTRSSTIMRLDPVVVGVVGVVGVLNGFCADDCPGSRTWHMQLLETQYVKDLYVSREISVTPANSRVMNRKNTT